MKINLDFIKKIFSRKIQLTNENDKIKLSKYSEYIPMYDIYSGYIYPISNQKLNYRLKECHYRFITSEVNNWILNLFNKTKDEKFKYNLDIIKNYNLDILEKTSYETLYKFSPELGLSISICKRNSFHPYFKHLYPYYSRDEIIKLGMNNNLIKKLTPENLIDKKLHYEICKTVSKNDISNIEIINSLKHIVDNNCINWVSFYSLTGSYIFNDSLRGINKLSNDIIIGLNKLNKCLNTSPILENNYYFYRFITDDTFLRKIKIGDTFTDNGFFSTTRDPFYSPGLTGDFGLILIKINIPKNKPGIGLFIENLSLFPNEQEYLLGINSMFKLINKNDNFKYHHINKEFENKIKKKYEFNYIGYKELDYNNVKIDIPKIDLENFDIIGNDRLTLFKLFYEKCNELGQFTYKNKNYICQYFDSETTYEDFHYNKTKNGFIVYHYDNGYPLLSLEFGEKLVVNFARTYNYYNNNQELSDFSNMKEIISYFGKIFKYKNSIIFFPYFNFNQFNNNYNNFTDKVLLNTYLYNKPIYDYFKNKKKYYNSNYFKFKFGYYQLDKIKNTNIHIDIINKLPKKLSKVKNYGELYINVVENHFYFYPKLEEYMNNKFNNLFKNAYIDFNIISYLKSLGKDTFDIPNIEHISNIDKGDRFKLIYETNILRI